MIFNTRNLEELENKHDSSGIAEDGEDQSNSEGVGEAAMEWRRQLIEEAVESVKRSKSRPVDPAITYEIKSLLFDRESRRFGRVQASVPGYLRIGYLTGGEREYGALDLEGYFTDFAAQRTAKVLAEALGMTEGEVRDHLDNVGLMAADDEEGDDTEAGAADVAPTASAKSAPAAKAARPAAAAAPAPVASASAAPPVAKKKSSKPARSKAKRAAKAEAPTEPRAPGSADPIEDPNAYIRENYMEMSNREMARVTGLSEHTIRRKLGEWGLKRKKKPKV